MTASLEAHNAASPERKFRGYFYAPASALSPSSAASGGTFPPGGRSWSGRTHNLPPYWAPAKPSAAGSLGKGGARERRKGDQRKPKAKRTLRRRGKVARQRREVKGKRRAVRGQGSGGTKVGQKWDKFATKMGQKWDKIGMNSTAFCATLVSSTPGGRCPADSRLKGPPLRDSPFYAL